MSFFHYCLLLNYFYVSTNNGVTLELTLTEEDEYIGRVCEGSSTNFGLTIIAAINILLWAINSGDNNKRNCKALQ